MSGAHLSHTTTHFHIEYWRSIAWGFSAATFVICSLILLSGECMKHKQHAESSQLEFISTQMGACLKRHPLVTHFFVLAMAIQMILLFDAFLRCMKYSPCHSNTIKICRCVQVSRQLFALICGWIIINFVVNLAGVSEFCSDGKHFEQMFHYGSAVGTITLFWTTHFLICLYLRGFAHAPDYKYIYIRKVYFALTCIFFILWILQIFFVVFFEVAKIVEWLILLSGLVLQCYAEYSLFQHTPQFVNKEHLCGNTHMDTRLVIRTVGCTYVYTLIVMIFSAPPWFIHANRIEPNLYTGAEYWSLVTATHVIVTVQLLYASFADVVCDNTLYAVFLRALRS
jgi:hypothetical protein